MFKKKAKQLTINKPIWLCNNVPRRHYDGSLFKDLAERWEHRGEKIRVEFIQRKMKVGDREGYYYDRIDYWTDATRDELHASGFLPGVRVPGYDAIQWWRQKVYVRLENYQQFDIHQVDEKTGQLLYPQDTPSTLHDEMTSNATKDFIKAMFKATLPTMDVQKIIMIAILGAGAVLGMMMLGVI